MFCRVIYLVAAVLLIVVPAANAAEVAGTVVQVVGTSTATGQTGTRSLSVNDKVFIQDSVLTREGARLKIAMTDGAELTLGEVATILISDYTFEEVEGRAQGNASLNLFKGAFLMVTGALKGGQDQNFVLNTPVATIGIRGTDFWGGRLDGHYNFALLGGKGIYVENNAGRVEINDIGFGTTVTSPDAPPSPPVKWKPEKVKRALETVIPDIEDY